MEINGGVYPNPNGSPIWPGASFTGPLIAGNVGSSDGTSVLAGVGESAGQANQGYVKMAQSVVVRQPTSGATTVATAIVVPAQSQITDIYAMVTVVQAAGTFGLGTTVSATAFTSASTAVSVATLGQITVLPTANLTQIANWDNVGNTDVQVLVTFAATGSASVTLTVFYVQGINLAS